VCYKRRPSHLVELHAIKMYNLIYAGNEYNANDSEASVGVTVMLIQWKHEHYQSHSLKYKHN
jgi:hypothetical protein